MVYRDGRTEFGNQNETFDNAVLGLDYRGQNLRLSADVGIRARTLNKGWICLHGPNVPTVPE